MITALLSDPWFLAAATAAAFFVGMGKGGLPVIASLGVPLMALFMSPVVAAALLLPTYVFSDAVGLILYRRHFSRRNLAILVPAMLAGVTVGWATAALIDDRQVNLFVGGLGVAFCINSWRGRRVPRDSKPADVPRGVLWGLISGFASFVSHSGGPPYQIYVLPQRMDKVVFAGTSTILFAIVNFSKILPYWSLGTLNGSNFKNGLMLVPVAIVGTLAGARLVRIIPQETFFIIVNVALFLISLSLIVEAVLGWS